MCRVPIVSFLTGWSPHAWLLLLASPPVVLGPYIYCNAVLHIVSLHCSTTFPSLTPTQQWACTKLVDIVASDRLETAGKCGGRCAVVGKGFTRALALCADGCLSSLLLLKLQCCGWPCPLLCEALVKLHIHVVHAHMFYMCHSSLTPSNTWRSVADCALYLLSLSGKRRARLWLMQFIWAGARDSNETTSRTQSKQCTGAALPRKEPAELAAALRLPTQYIYSISVRKWHNLHCWEFFYCTIRICICLQLGTLV